MSSMYETHARSLAKSVTYRLLAIISSIVMVGWVSAIYVEITKTFIFYACERLWLKVSWGIEHQQETWKRSVAKSIFYRVLATIAVAFWVGWADALWLAVVQTLLYVLNDRLWQLSAWGRISR